MVFADTLVRIIFHNWNKKLIQLPRFLGYLKQEKITLIATSPFLFVLEDVSLYSQLFPKGESTNIFFRLTLKFAGWYNLTIKWLHSGHCLDFPSRQRNSSPRLHQVWTVPSLGTACYGRLCCSLCPLAGPTCRIYEGLVLFILSISIPHISYGTEYWFTWPCEVQSSLWD